MGRTYVTVGLTAVLVAVSFVLARQLTMTRAAGEGGQAATMSLHVESPPDACDDADNPTTCSIPPDATFTVAVTVDGLPVDPKTEQEAGYVAFQSQVFYGDLAYDPAAAAADETVWPESALPVRSPAVPTGLEGIVAHGDASGVTPPLAPSGHTGNVVEIAFACPAQPQSFKLALLSYDPLDRPFGAGFKLLDQQTGELGQTVPAKTSGQQELDLDGQPETPPETVEVAAVVAINCDAPTPTNTSTATNTPTATPTPTPTATATPPIGDVNCDGEVDAIDAALILQLNAGLIGTLPCEMKADVSGDGAVNPIDAALILQFVAGLIDTLPP